jgi:hypothetical protein
MASVTKFGARVSPGSNYPFPKGSLPELKELATNALKTLQQVDQEWMLNRTAHTLYPVLAK